MAPKEETGFRALMQDRLRRWYQGGPAIEATPQAAQQRAYIAGLVNKSRLYDYAQARDIPMPQRYADVESVDALDIAALPERVVIKPNNSADCDAVMLLDGTQDLMNGATVPLAERPAYVARRIAEGRFTNSHTRIIAEELLQDCEPGYPIPRDFKMYVAGGRTQLVWIVNHNGPKSGWTATEYSRDWGPWPWRLTMERQTAPLCPCPPGFAPLLALSDRIAEDINCFMRVDFYLTPKGPVFGEFTSYPSAGRHFTPEGDRFLCDLMARYPDFA